MDFLNNKKVKADSSPFVLQGTTGVNVETSNKIAKLLQVLRVLQGVLGTSISTITLLLQPTTGTTYLFSLELFYTGAGAHRGNIYAKWGVVPCSRFLGVI